MNKIKKLIMFLSFQNIKRKARWRARKMKEQQFVVKIHGEIVIISKSEFKDMRQRGVFPQRFTARELKKVALHYTGNDKSGIQRTPGAVPSQDGLHK